MLLLWFQGASERPGEYPSIRAAGTTLHQHGPVRDPCRLALPRVRGREVSAYPLLQARFQTTSTWYSFPRRFPRQHLHVCADHVRGVVAINAWVVRVV